MSAGRKSFIVVRDFMIRDLKLQGVALLLYAKIYGFSIRDGKGCFEPQSSLADSLGVTDRAIGKALKLLKSRGLIIETGRYRLKSGRSSKIYKAVLPVNCVGSICPSETKFTEESSVDNPSTPEHSSAARPNKVPTKSKTIVKPQESKGADRFDKYNF